MLNKMIDYYLHKKCPLMFKGQREDIRCKGCIWLDQELRKCIFAVNFPRSITLEEFKQRISKVNQEQQSKLSQPFQRFVMEEK